MLQRTETRAPISSQWRRARQKAGNGPYTVASRLVACVRLLTAWNVASMCGCKSAPRLSSQLSVIHPIRSHLDTVLSTRTNHFATVKLQRRHTVLVFDRLKNPSSAQVPYLYIFVNVIRRKDSAEMN
jgi:hypothetical protein